ncbi:hypothetical protein [Actinacidiphila bryophytorum]|uniref:Uncharacterized protein n=1 Tax=Actinacidiphila bryophytorum TaxID=1436133 RepID=A0A9W4H134_9ACTN|nr:hypothetical protein [Actinacidiphila bryophytorum]MBM9439951.1 hypothetical protein [Actinacidiphila bryophytorum]MBN6546674.1 hypothetical protein [Actinacidiphila bryophytorum]CAG7640438.1 membrane hypothetical protein [Actinacidiphila bryophytorum]
MAPGTPASGDATPATPPAADAKPAGSRAARFAEARVMPLAADLPLLLLRLVERVPLLAAATYAVTVVERVALPLFLTILMVRNFSSHAGMLALSIGLISSNLTRSAAWAAISLRNTKGAALRLADPRFRISEVSDLRYLVSPQAWSEMHRHRSDEPVRVRVFVTSARDGIQVDDRTFTSYAGTSYVCMARDPRQARRAGVRFRLLHELGHASGAAMGNVEYEIVPAAQLVCLGSLLFMLVQKTVLSITVTAVLIALVYTVAKPFGPNREALQREIAADEFAIRHLAVEDVRQGVEDALLGPYRYQLRKLARARGALDRADLDRISLEFPGHRRVDTLDRLRPSFHTSRSPAWLRGHELQRVAIRASYAQLAFTRRLSRSRGAQLGLGSPYFRIPGWWQVRPLITVPLVVVAAFQVELPPHAWAYFTAAAVSLFFTHAYLRVRAAEWESVIDLIADKRGDAGEESEAEYRRNVEAAVAKESAKAAARREAKPQVPPIAEDPMSWPAATARALVAILLCSLQAAVLVAFSPRGFLHSAASLLALVFLSIVPGTYTFTYTKSTKAATLATWLAYLPMTAIVVLVLTHRL